MRPEDPAASCFGSFREIVSRRRNSRCLCVGVILSTYLLRLRDRYGCRSKTAFSRTQLSRRAGCVGCAGVSMRPQKQTRLLPCYAIPIGMGVKKRSPLFARHPTTPEENTMKTKISKVLFLALISAACLTAAGCGKVGEFKKALQCKNCNGTGVDEKQNYWFPPKCKACDGQGY